MFIFLFCLGRFPKNISLKFFLIFIKFSVFSTNSTKFFPNLSCFHKPIPRPSPHKLCSKRKMCSKVENYLFCNILKRNITIPIPLISGVEWGVVMFCFCFRSPRLQIRNDFFLVVCPRINSSTAAFLYIYIV